MYSDFKELLSVFNAHRVKYLIVGGYAVSLHAQPRSTKDLDILIKPDAENAKAAFTALAEFGAPIQGTTPEDFAQPGSFFRMGQEPVAVDILTEIPGTDFDAAWDGRIESVIDSATGLKAAFISSADLITAKRASARLQDLADVEAIQNATRTSPK